MTILTLIIGGLAVWRISHALVKEKGPLDMFIRFRARLAAHQKRSGGFFDLFSCVYCVSVWTGLVASAFASHDFFHWIGYAFAFSGIAVLLEAFFTNQTNSLSVVTPPAANNKVAVGVRAPSKQGNNVVSDPRAHYGSLAVKATTTLNN